MRLTELTVRNVRCLASIDIKPAAGLNFIIGDNGSGKTSLLEAIHILSRARSFRTSPHQRLINSAAESLTVFGRITADDKPSFTMGVQREKDNLRFKLSGMDSARILDMLRALPVQVVSPDLHALLERGPTQRRRFMDWGVFHVEHEFHTVWGRYHRALQQRNAGLRERQSAAQIKVWDTELVTTAEKMDELRARHVVDLEVKLSTVEMPWPAGAVSLDYQRGWSQSDNLASLLDSHLARDQRIGYTSVGPHRADLRLQWQGRQAADMASRGEQKLLIAMLLLLQAELVGEKTEVPPILLIDDMAAELGAHYRERFVHAVSESGLQAFLSFLESSQIPGIWPGSGMFHVKHGLITKYPESPET